jgi:hypothetical protein
MGLSTFAQLSLRLMEGGFDRNWLYLCAAGAILVAKGFAVLLVLVVLVLDVALRSRLGFTLRCCSSRSEAWILLAVCAYKFSPVIYGRIFGSETDEELAMEVQCYELHGLRVMELSSIGDQLTLIGKLSTSFLKVRQIDPS